MSTFRGATAKWNAEQLEFDSAFPSRPVEPRRFMLVRTKVIAGGVMFMGICWETQGQESRVTECLIVWFAMFSFYDGMMNLMEEGQLEVPGNESPATPTQETFL